LDFDGPLIRDEGSQRSHRRRHLWRPNQCGENRGSRTATAGGLHLSRRADDRNQRRPRGSNRTRQALDASGRLGRAYLFGATQANTRRFTAETIHWGVWAARFA
jgi:hypothetical protein